MREIEVLTSQSLGCPLYQYLKKEPEMSIGKNCQKLSHVAILDPKIDRLVVTRVLDGSTAVENWWNRRAISG